MKVKLLMLGPGTPGRYTSGLGRAASHLAQNLSQRSELTVIEPQQLNELNIKDNVGSKSEIFDDLSILQEMATVSVESWLSAYQYQEVTHSKTMQKVESHRLHEQLIKFTKELVLAGKKVDFDVLYAHDWITFKAALEIREQLKKPLVLHVHSLDHDRNFGQHKSWIFDLEQKAMKKADAIISVSNYSKNIIIDHYGINAEKIHVVPHGHHQKSKVKAKNPFKEKIILFVGRLSGQKGPELFLDIAEKVHDLYPESRYVMAGDGELYKKLIEAGSSSKIANKFHITGYLEDKDLQKLYSLSDVYCMPSFSEPFGLTAVEAAGFDLPLVLSSHCGAAEWLPESIILDPNDTDAFAQNIVTLLQDPELARKQTSANKKEIRKLSWETSSEQILSVIGTIQA